ncbi:MAG: hypothetical protein KAJ76_01700 [Candidatus Heimdallarchaeota archaeon]|nr:hypothetical protein [Candidatus Heimdallarchaeota archaeon]MCK5297590.1 hypothetical protein [Candidatus Heimdallarchaeota archaeon]
MTVLEAGVMFGGIPIVKINYYDDKATDSLLTAGLLEAIQAFAVEIFDDETETFKMKRYSIFLHKNTLKDKQVVTVYSICDSVDRPGTIKVLMQSIANAFHETFDNVNMGCLNEYEDFKEIITKKLGDLIYRPEDRLRKVFL